MTLAAYSSRESGILRNLGCFGSNTRQIRIEYSRVTRDYAPSQFEKEDQL
jgi:hypothetical protein